MTRIVLRDGLIEHCSFSGQISKVENPRGSILLDVKAGIDTNQWQTYVRQYINLRPSSKLSRFGDVKKFKG